jgi:hypothetical protein
MGKINPKHAFFTAEGFRETAMLAYDARKKGNLLLGIPTVTNAAFALEMYLKCLLVVEGGNQKSGHDLQKLFMDLSPETQTELTKAHDNFVKEHPIFAAKIKIKGQRTDLKSLLSHARGAFVNFRYMSEKPAGESGWGLSGFTRIVRDRILAYHPDWDVNQRFDPPKSRAR